MIEIGKNDNVSISLLRLKLTVAFTRCFGDHFISLSADTQRASADVSVSVSSRAARARAPSTTGATQTSPAPGSRKCAEHDGGGADVSGSSRERAEHDGKDEDRSGGRWPVAW